MQKVLDHYHKHITRIMCRAAKTKRDMTYNERKGVAFYSAAFHAVQALMDAPTPAWVGLTFAKETTHRL